MKPVDTTNKRRGEKIHVVYDRQCPICHLYCELAQSSSQRRAKNAPDGPAVELLDAREHSELMQRITHLGLDIDEGMVVEIGDELHYGADAIHALALQEPGRGLFGVLSRLFFGRRWSARILYPWLRRVRNLLLRVLGKQRINNLELPGRDKF